MAESAGKVSIIRLIALPAAITLAVTILRLVGELQHWPSSLFNPSPGGDGSIVGIVWLAPIFGIYFAVKLAGSDPNARPVRAILMSLVGLGVMFVGVVVVSSIWKEPGTPGSILVINAVGAIAGLIQFFGWPMLSRALLAYGLAARIPVVIVMFLAIRGDWGTHYDAPPPAWPAGSGWFSEFLLTGFLPQLMIWIGFTLVAGSLFGGIVAALARRRAPVVQPG